MLLLLLLPPLLILFLLNDPVLTNGALVNVDDDELFPEATIFLFVFFEIPFVKGLDLFDPFPLDASPNNAAAAGVDPILPTIYFFIHHIKKIIAL